MLTRILESTDLQVWKLGGPEGWPWWTALVTTRHGGQSPPPYATLNLGLACGDDAEHVHANRDHLRRALGITNLPLTTLRQVHGTRVLQIPGPTTGVGDGLWTQEPGHVLVIGIADCTPVLVWDATQHRIALLHAGWRGTADGILRRTLETWSALGSKSQDLWVELGPSIGPCCYEVGPEVALRFPGEVQNGRQLDLRSANRLQALQHGVPRNQIADDPPCTACQTETFFSYRKEKSTGRLWALAWIHDEVEP